MLPFKALVFGDVAEQIAATQDGDHYTQWSVEDYPEGSLQFLSGGWGSSALVEDVMEFEADNMDSYVINGEWVSKRYPGWRPAPWNELWADRIWSVWNHLPLDTQVTVINFSV